MPIREAPPPPPDPGWAWATTASAVIANLDAAREWWASTYQPWLETPAPEPNVSVGFGEFREDHEEERLRHRFSFDYRQLPLSARDRLVAFADGVSTATLARGAELRDLSRTKRKAGVEAWARDLDLSRQLQSAIWNGEYLIVMSDLGDWEQMVNVMQEEEPVREHAEYRLVLDASGAIGGALHRAAFRKGEGGSVNDIPWLMGPTQLAAFVRRITPAARRELADVDPKLEPYLGRPISAPEQATTGGCLFAALIALSSFVGVVAVSKAVMALILRGDR